MTDLSGNGLTKDLHPWQQGINEAEYQIENLSYENDLVGNPFVGSGTTALAAKRLNRRFVGSLYPPVLSATPE
jgi:site-specific DNA-methyltransferase (adenine-specific)